MAKELDIHLAIDKRNLERAWNAALEISAEIADESDINLIEDMKAPSKEFDEWYLREFLDAPESWDDHHN